MPAAAPEKPCLCRTCGGEMIQKSRARLVIVGACMMAAMFIPIYVNWFWAPGIILAMTGIYLLVWATLGQGRWCRNCKKFNFLGRN